MPSVIEIPAKLIKNHRERSADWLAGLPEDAATYLDRWQLTVAGEPLSGEASLILPAPTARKAARGPTNSGATISDVGASGSPSGAARKTPRLKRSSSDWREAALITQNTR